MGVATHLSPGELTIEEIRFSLKREGGRKVEKQTCSLTFRDGKGMCISGLPMVDQT